MLSFLYFVHFNNSVRLPYLIGLHNTLIGRILYLYNPYIYKLLNNKNRILIEDTKEEIVDKEEVNTTKKLNTYQKFVKDNYKRIKDENPFLTSKEIITELGKEWSENKNKSL